MEEFLVKNAAATAYYIPDFITDNEETYLLERVTNAPKPKWEQLSHRRLQNWGGFLGKKGLIIDSELPPWLKSCIDKICQLPGVFPETNRPNHVLVNEYLPGQGIMPHVDGPMYHPVIATINLGGHTVLDMYRRSNECEAFSSMAPTVPESNGTNATSQRVPVGSLLLERRSLVLIKDDLYTDHLHGIADRSQDVITEDIWNLSQCQGRTIGDNIDRSTRVSLTIRNIPKVTYLIPKK